MLIHSDQHPFHDYLQIMYLEPLRRYALDRGHPVSMVADLTKMRNDTVLVDTEHLNESVTAMLLNNGCKIVGFNLIDSSGIAAPLVTHMDDCALIFSITGLQTTNIGHELEFDGQFQPKMVARKFLPDDLWQTFDGMRRSERLLSLPYVHWERQQEPGHLPYGEKNGKVLIRGGAHMRRVVLAFFLLRAGLLDEMSGFALRDFFLPEMDTRFRFCGDCRATMDLGRYPYRVDGYHEDCTGVHEWGGEHLHLDNLGAWNNRCPRSFYWLAEKFEAAHGPINHALVESIFNQAFVSPEDHQRILRKSSFTADLKWLHSIYIAQRFWDAAICGTVNLLPARTFDQEYFPKIEVNEHFLAFKENCPLDGLTLRKEEHEHITNNAWALYTEWIRPTDYAINTSLLEHMLSRITAI